MRDEKIEVYACLDIDECIITAERKLPENTKSVCFFLIPYNMSDNSPRNVSLYAVPRDYHLYVKQLEERLKKRLIENSEDDSIRIFADNSPFDERACAERSGLGFIGKNNLLINSKYGSYVFIGSICLASDISISHCKENFKGNLCGNCEICLAACPVKCGKCSECLSEITQKKKTDAFQEKIISEYPIKWGCDICQQVCPKNKGVEETPLEFFKKDRLPKLSPQKLSDMSDAEFSERAYAWRGRAVIERNLKL